MYPYIKARWFTPTKGRVIDLIVVHSMEAPEKGNTAENVARYFQTTSTKASAHYCADNDSIVQSVADRDVAYGAPGANHNGLQIELAGYARQSRADWEDGFSDAMLRRVAVLIADKAREYGVPVRYRDSGALRKGGGEMRGITTHNECRLAWQKTSHRDPGPGFPMDKLISYVEQVNGTRVVGSDAEAMVIAMGGVPHAIDACLIPGYRSVDGAPAVWVLSSDGGVFTFPEKSDPVPPFWGGMGGKPLNAPLCKIVAPGTSQGYYLIGEDGGIFAYGSAKPVAPYEPFMDEFRKSVHKIVGAEWVGSGLVLLASDGAAYTFEVK